MQSMQTIKQPQTQPQDVSGILRTPSSSFPSFQWLLLWNPAEIRLKSIRPHESSLSSLVERQQQSTGTCMTAKGKWCIVVTFSVKMKMKLRDFLNGNDAHNRKSSTNTRCSLSIKKKKKKSATSGVFQHWNATIKMETREDGGSMDQTLRYYFP